MNPVNVSKILLSVMIEEPLQLTNQSYDHMKRKFSIEEESNKPTKMTKLVIEEEGETSMIVASGGNMSASLARHFNYELSDKKAKSNLLKGAAREMIELDEKQKCTMFSFSVGSFLLTAIPSVLEWQNDKKVIEIGALKLTIEDVLPGYDDSGKHVETLIRFRMNGEKITVCCYYIQPRE